MQHSPAVTLLDAIQSHCGVEASFARVSRPDACSNTWMVVARGAGQIWRVEHPDLLLAVATLEKMISRHLGSGSQQRNSSFESFEGDDFFDERRCA